MSNPHKKISSLTDKNAALNIVLLMSGFFLLSFLPVSMADNCGWPTEPQILMLDVFFQSPTISSLNMSNMESCTTTFVSQFDAGFLDYKQAGVILVTDRFNLSRSGSCSADTERLVISDLKHPEDKPKIWCGGEHARALEFPNGVNLTYFPGTKGQGSGFKMQLIPDYSFPVCISDQRPLEARDTPTFLYSLQGGYGYERDDCRWNVTAPDDKVVLVRSFATKIFPRYGSWFPFLGRFFEPVDFLDLNTDESSVELDESYFELVGSSTRGSLLAEYVAASKRDVDCVNSTTVEVDLDAEETLIQLHSSTSSCTLRFTTGSSDKTIDLSFLPVTNNATDVDEAEFAVEFMDGNTTFLNSSEVNQLPFRRIQSAHSQVTLTYQNLKVNKGSRSNIHAWVRARALSPDVFPKHLRATSAKSYLWISLEQLSGSENPQLQMYNFQKCARLQAMDQTQSTSLIASDLFSVYSGFHATGFDMSYDCLGRRRMGKTIITSERVSTLSFKRNASSSGFWLVYDSIGTDDECKDLSIELTNNGSQYRVPESILTSNSQCRFTIASDLAKGQQVRILLQSPYLNDSQPLRKHLLTVRKVLPGDDGDPPKKLPMIFGDNWISDQWIYSSFPLELDLSFGSKLWQSFNVTFEIIDERIPKCGNTDLTATRVPQRVTSPYYPDFYPSNLTCIWKIRKSSSALINEHMVIEVEANEHKPCQGTDESLVIYHYSDDATISDVLTNIGYCGSRKFYQMYMNGYLEARLTSWIYTVGPGFSFSYFTMERNETCKHEIILSGSNMPYRLSYQILPQYFTGFSYECQWLFKPSASGYAARARNVSVESPAYISRYAVTTDISSGALGTGLMLQRGAINRTDDVLVSTETDIFVLLMAQRISFNAPVTISMDLDTVKITGCDGTRQTVEVTGDSQYWTSLDYPNLYKSDVACVWNLHASNSKYIKIEVADLKLSGSAVSGNCLSFTNTYGWDDTDVDSVCTDNPEKTSWTIENNRASLTFKTDPSGPGARFRVRLQAVDKPTFNTDWYSEHKTATISASLAGVSVIFFIIGAICRAQSKKKGNPLAQTNANTVEGNYNSNLAGNYNTAYGLADKSANPTAAPPPAYSEVVKS